MSRAFEELLKKRDEHEKRHREETVQIQEACVTECLEAWKGRFGKRKFSLARSRELNEWAHLPIWRKWSERAEVVCREARTGRAAIEANLKEEAARAEIPPFEGLSLYRQVDSGCYRSMGWGEHQYARAEAEDHADKARAYGLEAHIREVLMVEGRSATGETFRVIDYQIWVSTTQAGVELLRRKPGRETMAEWVRKCDRRCVNPHVYMPFLSSEEAERLRKTAKQ